MISRPRAAVSADGAAGATASAASASSASQVRLINGSDQRSRTTAGPDGRLQVASASPAGAFGAPAANGTTTCASPVCSVNTGRVTSSRPSSKASSARPGTSNSSAPAWCQTTAPVASPSADPPAASAVSTYRRARRYRSLASAAVSAIRRVLNARPRVRRRPRSGRRS